MLRFSTRVALFISIFSLWICPLSLRAQTAPTLDAWDKALAAVGLTKDTAVFDFTDMANHGANEFVLPYFDAMHRYPMRIPFYAQVLRTDALKAAPSPGNLVMTAAWRMGEGTRRTLIRDPLADEMQKYTEPNALTASIRALHAAAGKPLSEAQEKTLVRSVKVLPADVAQNAALLLLTTTRSIQWRNRGLARFKSAELQHVFDQLNGIKTDPTEGWDDSVDDLRHTIDLKYLLAGGINLTIAAERATAALEKRIGTEHFHFEWAAPQGRIVLRGNGNDEYSGDQPYLLIIDTGGNETYYGGGATYSAAHPASVLIDLEGNDRYLEQAGLATTPVAEYPARKEGTRPTFGAGVLGYGILIDSQGDDFYRSLKNTQGRGLYGLGLLYDREGDDRYDSYTGGQGAGEFGVGVLADLNGADQYRCFTTSQGFARTMGAGYLVDAGNGDDLYDANDTVIDFPAPQDKTHNATLAQGMGYGRRADHSDGHSLSGGIGVLIEGGGKNSFSCGIFGQGAGYWYGLGLLSTGEGDDSYKGVWYTQGASAHFAVGVLWDSGGNDNYAVSHHASQGLGHDFGTGFLIEDSGNDTYQVGNLSLGAGNNNGFGFVWEKAGDDTYVIGNESPFGFGGTNLDDNGRSSIRPRNRTLGIFLDTGGNDTYPPAVLRARNNTLWLMPRTEATLPVQSGVGIDTDAP